jgi:hypothetical protein
MSFLEAAGDMMKVIKSNQIYSQLQYYSFESINLTLNQRKRIMMCLQLLVKSWKDELGKCESEDIIDSVWYIAVQVVRRYSSDDNLVWTTWLCQE